MGCCASGLTDEEYQAYWVNNAGQFKAMGLSERDIKVFLLTFKAVERKKVNANGEVLIMDIVGNLFDNKASSNVFWLKCFQIFDTGERPGDDLLEARLDFRQFVYAVWNICSLSHKNLIRFVFDVYNTEKQPEVPIKLLRTMITDLYGEIKASKNADAEDAKYIVMDSVRNQLDGYNESRPYRVDEFVAFCHLHPAAFFPAYDALELVHTRFFGIPYWAGRTKWREQQPVRFQCVKDLKYMCEHQGMLPKTTAIPETNTTDSRSAGKPAGKATAASLGLPDEHKPRTHLHLHAQIAPKDFDKVMANSTFVIPKANTAPRQHHDIVHHNIDANYVSVAAVEANKKTWAPDLVNEHHNDGQFDEHRPHQHHHHSDHASDHSSDPRRKSSLTGHETTDHHTQPKRKSSLTGIETADHHSEPKRKGSLTGIETTDHHTEPKRKGSLTGSETIVPARKGSLTGQEIVPARKGSLTGQESTLPPRKKSLTGQENIRS